MYRKIKVVKYIVLLMMGFNKWRKVCIKFNLFLVYILIYFVNDLFVDKLSFDILNFKIDYVVLYF